MSKLEELIERLCPDGVEYLTLQSVTINHDRYRRPVTKKDRLPGIYPYYGANGIQDYVDNYIFDGVFLLIGEDGSVINKDGSPILTWAQGKIWVNNHAHVLSEKDGVAQLRYIFYALQVTDVSTLVRGTPPKLNQDNLNNIMIPVPPLKVQQEIVRILDTFTALEAELEAELEARKKQYEFYRNSLIDLDQDFPVMNLGDLVHYSNTRINATNLCVDNYVGVDNLLSEKRGKEISSYVPKSGMSTEYTVNDILIGNIRPYLRKIWLANCIGGTNGDVLVLRINKSKTDELNPRYLYHLLASEKFFQYNISFSKGAKMPRGDKDKIMSFEVRVPSLGFQKNAVEFLDKFEELVNDISIGLPAEIAGRRKQYEYYRNKLLTFKEVKHESV